MVGNFDTGDEWCQYTRGHNARFTDIGNFPEMRVIVENVENDLLDAV